MPEPFPEAALKLPGKDRPVLAAAIRLECEALVTDDRTTSAPCTARRWAV